MNNQTELLPCPFCGSEDVHLHDNGCTYRVICDAAELGHCAIGPDAMIFEAAIAQWNTRAILADLRGEK